MKLLSFIFFCASVASGQCSNWYVELQVVGGNHDGSSWANAWQSVTYINHSVVMPGDTVWIGGGPQGTTNRYNAAYNQYSATVNDGTALNPIWIRFDGTNTAHNGTVELDQFFIKSKYTKFDGARDQLSANRWYPKNVIETYFIPTNIAVWCVGTNADSMYDTGTGFGTDKSIGQDIYWLGSRDQYARHDKGRIIINQVPGYTNEVAYICMTNYFDYCFKGTGLPVDPAINAEAFGALSVHHCLLLEGQDNLQQDNNSMDFHDNIFISSRKYQRDSDGWQTGNSKFRIWNNILCGVTTRWGSMFPAGTNYSQKLEDWYVFNNIFFGPYDTWHGAAPEGTPIPNQDCIADQMWGPELFSSYVYEGFITNHWMVNNVFHSEFGGAVFYWTSARGTGPFTQATNAVGDGTYFYNNTIVAPTNYSSPLVKLQQYEDPFDPTTSGWGFHYKTNDVIFDYNNIFSSSPNIQSYKIAYSTNNYVITELPISWGWGSGNRTNITAFVRDVIVNHPSYLYVPTWTGTNQAQFGTNLSGTRIATIAPWVTNDILGNPRSSGQWNMGPYELRSSWLMYPNQDTNLLLWINWNDWDGGTNITDSSIYTNQVHTYGLWVTNVPTLTSGPQGMGKAAHFTGNGVSGGEFSYRGQWAAVHPVNTNLYDMTNATVCVWASPEPVSPIEVGNSSVLLDAYYQNATGANSWRLGHYYSMNTRLVMLDKSGNIDDTNRFQLLFWDDYDHNAWVNTIENVNYISNGWHHYAFTYDGTSLRGYYDGKKFQTTNVTGIIDKLHLNTTADWLAIGCWQHEGTAPQDGDTMPNTGWWQGGMDDIRIYNRCLSDAEISDLYYKSKQAIPLAFNAITYTTNSPSGGGGGSTGSKATTTKLRSGHSEIRH